MKINYLPQNENALLNWLQDFTKNLPVVGRNLGVTPAEVSSLNALIVSVKDDIRRGLEDKEIKKENMLNFLTMIIDKMRSHPNYSINDQGKKLGIAG